MSVKLLNSTYYQIIDSESPNNSTFDKSGSSSVVTFLVNQSQLKDFFKDVLGVAQLKNNSYVTRSIPASHPIFPWQYAYKILSIKGYNPDGKEESKVVKLDTSYKNIKTESPVFVGSYESYKIAVSFTSRNYAIYSDDQLQAHHKLNQSYFMPIRKNFQGEWGERQEIFNDRFEHGRFTNFDYEPDVELLNYGGGNYWCKRGNDLPADVPKEFPVSSENQGNVNLKITKVKLSFNWFQVPYELCVNNQIWQDAYSKINLNDFFFFPKGSLLFAEAVVRKYEPFYPFQTIDLTQNSSVYDYFTEYNKNQYADVTFKFSLFYADSGILVTPNLATYHPLNCKDINSLHNRLMGPASKYWYYVESARAIPFINGQGDQVGWAPDRRGSPCFWNYPFSNLFNYVEGP